MNNNSGSYSRVLYEETHNTSSSCDARGSSKRVALLSIWIINISDGNYKGERVLRMTQITNVFAFPSSSTGPTFRPSRGSHQQITTLFCLILRWWQCKFIQQRLINHNPFSVSLFLFLLQIYRLRNSSVGDAFKDEQVGRKRSHFFGCRVRQLTWNKHHPARLRDALIGIHLHRVKNDDRECLSGCCLMSWFLRDLNFLKERPVGWASE